MTVGAVTKVLVANRGEISLRAQRACKKLGLGCVSVFTEPDALSLHVLHAGESVCLGASPKEYLNAERLIEVAKDTGCDAVFPGYGFLSENTDFSAMCEDHGIAFIGPTADTMRMFAQKHTARELAERAEVPVLAGSPLLNDGEEALAYARKVGLPVLLKATGGGGGIGIHICRTEEEVMNNFTSAARQGAAAFGDAGVFVEKYVQNARHIEVQIFGDGKGNVVAFPERECSIQRRHQKILEETPSPFVTPELRERLQGAAVRLGQVANYRSAGTVEYIVDDDTGDFYFLEVNTRLQVEHGITEMITGVDLVAMQFELQGAKSQGNLPADLASFQPGINGHAIEVRICAEDPAHGYRPCTGVLGQVSWPTKADTRVDTWVETGVEVSAYYDSLLAKLMVHSPEGRPTAIAKMCAALEDTQLKGVCTNLEFLRVIAASERYASGNTTTKFVEFMDYSPPAVEFLEAGLQTTVQDYPGRVALWAVGVPPSGPMDDLSHRLANALVGNDDHAAALEVTLTGPTMKFLTDTVVAVCGAEAPVTLEGEAVAMWQSFAVKRGQVVAVGATSGGSRAYIAIAGGLDVPDYLGSKSTFPGGNMGGHQGRALRPGDMLFLVPADLSKLAVGAPVPAAWRPQFCSGVSDWSIGVLPGPQADPDYFTPEDMQTFYSTAYKIHHNSNRLGIRMEGPRPKFARLDGGEGGSHPSNVHDHVYAIGTINYTGDMPIALMVDGPSLGGFVCPATITTTELWKMGQVRPGDAVQFRKLTITEAYTQRFTVDKQVSLVCQVARSALTTEAAEAELAAFKVDVPEVPPTEAVLRVIPKAADHPGGLVRMAGDRYIFLEYGPMELDIGLRVRVHEIEQYLADKKIDGLIETCPGVRSVMIEYDQRRLRLSKLLELIDEAEANMQPADNVKLPHRILHLPMAFNEKWTHDAINRYMRSARSEAPYLPSNVKFIAANNGLEGDPIEAVRQVLFDASYMVLGLGDVYLGAPCAVPIDPRHRLVVPKYNPARTFTPEGSVGIGGTYMCIYPMNSPGGYQLVGRTLPIWNPFTRTGPFTAGKPWLLRNFDQVKYYEVTEDELETLRTDFKNGRLELRIENATFSVHEYNEFMKTVEVEYVALRQRQSVAIAEQNALDAEMLEKMDAAPSALVRIEVGESDDNPYEGQPGTVVTGAVTGTVWEIKIEAGQAVKKGDTLIVLEAMKMEYAVLAPCDGTVKHLRVAAGDMCSQGSPLCLLT